MDEQEGISQEAHSTEENGTAPSYHDRVRLEPDFAVDEIRKKDSYIGQLNQRMAKLKEVERYVDTLGSPDALLELASYGNSVRNNPQVLRAIEEALNGKPQPAQPEVELYDPETKMVYDRVTKELEQRDHIIRDLQSRLDRTEVASVKVSLRENIDTALSKFKDDPDLNSEAQDQIVKAVEGLERAAASGNRSAANQLEQLASPSGAQVLRMMTMDIYDRYVDKRLQSKAPTAPDGATLRSKATDDRNNTRSAPPSNEVSVKPGTKVTTQLVRQLMQEGARKLGKDPNAFWR